MRRILLAGICAGLMFWAAPLTAAPVAYIAFLDGPSESPPNASPGSGTAQVTIDAMANTMHVEVDFSGLLGIVSAAHIHVINGPGDTNLADTIGPVATTTPTFAGFPAGVTAGSYDITLDMTQATSYRAGWITDSGGTTAVAQAQLFAGIDQGRAYFNIHSSAFPGGEIRGFLQPVPEPASGLLALAAIAGLAWFAPRRRRTD